MKINFPSRAGGAIKRARRADKPLTHQGEATLLLRAVTQGQISVDPVSAFIRLCNKDGRGQNAAFVLSCCVYPSAAVGSEIRAESC